MQHSFRTDGISVRTMLEAALVFIYNGEVLFSHIDEKYVTLRRFTTNQINIMRYGKK